VQAPNYFYDSNADGLSSPVDAFREEGNDWLATKQHTRLHPHDDNAFGENQIIHRETILPGLESE
jgi:hypothetical protein